MTDIFKEKIIKLRDSGVDLFYNSNGSVVAYKLGVKHLSASPSFGYAIRFANEVRPYKTISIVDFDKEEIFETENNIILIPLKNIP